MSTLDLNLLASLDALIDEGSVTRAARRLHLSPAAMSRALGRVREHVGDAILVRAGRAMVLTERARELREPVRAALRDATRALSPAAPISLANVERVVTIRSTDIVVGSLVPALSRVLEETAPRVGIRYVGEGDEDVKALRDGTVDLDIGALGRSGPEIRQQALLRTSLVCAMRAKHPLARGRGKLTAARFASFGHVAVSRRGIARGPIDAELGKIGLSRHVALTVPTFLLAAWLASEGDLLVCLPRVIAATAAKKLGLALRPIPVPTPPIVVGQTWHPRYDTDPVHRWLRGQIHQLMGRYRERD